MDAAQVQLEIDATNSDAVLLERLGVEGLLSLVTGDVSVTVEGRVFEHRFASRARSTGDGRQM